jgi:hypothetical protein
LKIDPQERDYLRLTAIIDPDTFQTSLNGFANDVTILVNSKVVTTLLNYIPYY